MLPISGISTGAAQSLPAAEKTVETPDARRPEAAGRPLKPAMDEYVPEEKQEPTGLYWPGRDEDGQPKICFDGPERAAGASGVPDGTPDTGAPKRGGGAGGPEKSADEKEGTCTANTDKADREIEKLKKRQKELEQRLSAETDEAVKKDLEKELARVEDELRRKDTDAYRRQHTTFTRDRA